MVVHGSFFVRIAPRRKGPYEENPTFCATDTEIVGELRYPLVRRFWVHFGSNNVAPEPITIHVSTVQFKHLPSAEYSPEKAGVGGSTPSLATIILNGLAARSEISHLS